jgi:MFS family permease
LRFANLDVAFSTAFQTLVTGAFLVGFIQALGGSDLWIGLLAAVPSLAGLVQIPGAIWGRGFASYKAFIWPGGLVWRLLYIPVAILPFLPIPPALKLTLLTVCVLLGSLSVAAVNSIYNDWLAELIPADSRGFFFARRNAIATATGAGVGLVGAFILDALRSSGQEPLAFGLVFGLAIVCAFVSFFFFMQMRDLPRIHPIRQKLWDGVKAIRSPFGDRDFRRVLIFLTVITLGQLFAGNLFIAYARESLHLDFRVIQLLAVFNAGGNVASAKMWGFLSDKYGNKPMLAVSVASVALNPIAWLATIPGQNNYNTILLLLTHILMGAGWGGVAVCQFNLILATAKTDDRANYIGAGLSVISAAGGLGPLFGAALMASLRTTLATVLAYKLVFGAVIVFRLASLYFLGRVTELGSTSIRETLKNLKVSPRGMRAMRALARTSSGEGRISAIQDVGEQGVAMASDAIIKALHDPLPRVRREAAVALSRLSDPRAVEELIHQIEEHPDLLEEETVEALGLIRDRKAIPALIRMLHHPSALIRRASAKALGRVAGPTDDAATDALIVAAQDESDADLRRSGLQALRLVGASDAVDVFCQALRDPLPSIRIAAAEAIAELRITSAAEELRSSIRTFEDEAASEAAYALGVVGVVDDLPAILCEAGRCTSMITRRRCLLGAAHLLGVEQPVYRLMLQEGMARDTAIADLLAHAGRRQPKVRLALERFAQDDEKGAVRALANALRRPELQALADNPVQESFLLAAAYSASHYR